MSASKRNHKGLPCTTNIQELISNQAIRTNSTAINRPQQNTAATRVSLDAQTPVFTWTVNKSRTLKFLVWFQLAMSYVRNSVWRLFAPRTVRPIIV